METTIDLIHKRVKNMYEDYPYPSYPMWAPLRWQEAYQGTAHFAAQQGISASLLHSENPRILIAGCGETQPYILRKIEPKTNQIDAIDISTASIRRARQRLIFEPKPLHFFNQDLEYFFQEKKDTYDHIDCYGVLHHLANPTLALQNLYQCLKPGGTARIMVYNDNARAWIYQIKRALMVLGFNPHIPIDLRYTQEFLQNLSYWIPSVRVKLKEMGKSTLNHPARLVDTFFHAREARIQIAEWYSAAKQCGFRLRGLFDRYAELDDLPNPLWSIPSLNELNERAKDHRFENNIELYLQRASNVVYLKPSGLKPTHLLRHYTRGAPKFWFGFKETESIPINLRQLLWWHHLMFTYQNKTGHIDQVLGELSQSARQRLGRIGAVHPKQIHLRKYREEMKEPMWPEMDIPEAPKFTPVQNTPLTEVIRAIRIRNGRPESVEQLAIERLNRAQTC